ncbi:hypothetical protein acdb102_38700 [Acidothermaceae bacterium B102]|nr:hypothetical protein acdb102_38700 [Acidothermaceae bacterium B102]
MRLTPLQRLLVGATTGALVLISGVAPSSATVTRRGFADLPTDAGYVQLHSRHSATYSVGAHRQLGVVLAGLPSSGIVAAATVALTLTATSAGAVTLWPAGTRRPAAATVIFSARRAVTASTVVTAGAQLLLNNSSHTVKVTVTTQGYYPVATAAFDSGAPGWFVPVPAVKAVSVTLKARATTTYKTLKASPPRTAAVVISVSATGSAKGQLRTFPWHSKYTTHASLAMTPSATTNAVQVVQPSGEHWLGLQNLSAGPAKVTATALGYVMPFHTPSQPQHVYATGVAGRVLVAWQQPLDVGGLPITSYVVTVYPNGPLAPSAGAVTTVSGTSTGAAITLGSGHDYWFGVAAVTAAGQGQTMTTNVPASPTSEPPPGPPGHVTARSTAVGQATVRWSASPGNGAQPVTSYTVVPSHGTSVTVPASSLSAVLSLTPGLTDTFAVTATDLSGSSTPVTSSPATILGVPVPGVTTRVSTALEPSAQSNTRVADGEAVAVSRGGRFVAFGSAAPDLVAGDTNGARDIFVRDLVSGVTTRVSVASDGTQGDDNSYDPVISDDGRYVAFDSYATNLTTLGWDGHLHVYRHDLQTGVTTLVTIDQQGFQADGYEPTMSADGNEVAFVSPSDRIAGAAISGVGNVYVRDMSAAATVLASVGIAGADSNGNSEAPAISADGNSVAFASYSGNLVAGVPNGWEQVFLRNLTAGTTAWVSEGMAGSQPNADSYGSAVSADGRYVAFESAADNLVAGDDNSLSSVDVFLRDVQSGTTTRVSVSTAGLPTAGDPSFRPVSLSADGRRVGFTFPEDGLVAGDALGAFVHDMATGVTSEASVASDGSSTATDADAAALSPDGGFEAFESVFADPHQVDGLPTWGVYLHALG